MRSGDGQMWEKGDVTREQLNRDKSWSTKKTEKLESTKKPLQILQWFFMIF